MASQSIGISLYGEARWLQSYFKKKLEDDAFTNYNASMERTKLTPLKKELYAIKPSSCQTIYDMLCTKSLDSLENGIGLMRLGFVY